MPIDPSIIAGLRPVQVQQRDPLEAYGKSLALKNMMGQGDLQALQMQQARQGVEDENAVRDAYRQAGGDSKALRALLQQRGAHKHLQALDKAELEAEARRAGIDKDKAAAGKSQFDVQIGKVQHGSAMLQVARDNPAAWPSVRRAMQMNFPELAAQLPEQYDQAFVDAKIAAGQTITQRLQDAREREKIAETARGHDLTATVAREGHGVTRRGQDLTATVAREGHGVTKRGQDQPIWSAEHNAFIARPGTVPAGAPAVIRPEGLPATTPKLTEDQGKATGWLVQADNAFKNMKKAIDPMQGGDPSAAKPGFNDVLAAIPSGGLTTGVANMMRGDRRQQFIQASSSLSEALLRAATGAGVNRDEAEQKVKELTPQIGDGDDVRKQKLEAIPLYIESLKVRAGPGAAQLPGIRERGVPQPTPRDVPQGGLPPRPPAQSGPVTKVINGKTYTKVNGQWFEGS